ncbi:cytochrome c, class I (plasmid) [Nitrobacter hamburgensis X14]|uniref:Cytochrome c, class I n=1 Tax=Nitrobacter hamburgensis (strain DSM 10229 / NCIMB 13809 / X14) TaxID=323097 RepID=Q1QFY9_NITHX|nr:cytochrome c, class I [Nitrobacter hamburgensis X14]
MPDGRNNFRSARSSAESILSRPATAKPATPIQVASRSPAAVRFRRHSERSSPNITPDRETGIGAWTDDQFYRSLHEGIADNGSHLYPAFPYPWYTKVTRDDALAIRAYLNSLDPVKAERRPNDLIWPLNHREMMAGWNEIFFTKGEFSPDPKKSAEWNRGAYLVEGLGHCGACHTPTNFLGAAKASERLQGGTLQDWYAPDLAGELRSGLGSWSADDIVQFLKLGRNNRTAAYGPMAEVITNSTSKLNDGDLKAIATYLKDMPAPATEKKPGKPDPKLVQAGKAIYIDNCSACHRSNGEGTPGTFPSLKGDTTVQDRDPTTIIRLILDGVHAVATDARPTPLSMPSFSWKLSDEQIAAVASYIRSAWGNAASPVSESDVQPMRQVLHGTAK